MSDKGRGAYHKVFNNFCKVDGIRVSWEDKNIIRGANHIIQEMQKGSRFKYSSSPFYFNLKASVMW